MTEMSKELGMFIEYARKHGVDIQVVKSDNPDTFEKIFGELCEDAISRKEALSKMQAYYDDCAKTSEYTRLGFETAMEVVKSLPLVQPQQRTGYWIPVSEKSLPNIGKCLVAVKHTSRHNICDSVIAYFDGKHFYRNVHDRAFISGVKAWMPLPEPYKEE